MAMQSQQIYLGGNAMDASGMVSGALSAGPHFIVQTGPGEYLDLSTVSQPMRRTLDAKHRNQYMRGHRRKMAGKPSYRQRQASSRAATAKRGRVGYGGPFGA